MSQANTTCPVCQARLTPQDVQAARCSACGAALTADVSRETIDEDRLPSGADSVDDLARSMDTVDEATLAAAMREADDDDTRQTIDESQADGGDTRQTLDESQLGDGDIQQTVDEQAFAGQDAGQQTIDESQPPPDADQQTVDESQLPPGAGRQTVDEAAPSGGAIDQTIDEGAQTVDESSGVVLDTDQASDADKSTVDERDVGRTIEIPANDGADTGTVGDEIDTTIDEEALAALAAQQQQNKGTGTVDERAVSQTIDMGESPEGVPPKKETGTVDERSIARTLDSEAAIPLAGGVDQDGTVDARSMAQTLDSGELSPEAAARVNATWQGVVGDGVTSMTSIKQETPGEEGDGNALVIHARRFSSDKDKDRDADYGIQRLLGEGGMGMVYAARQASIDRTVAVKTLKPDTAKDRTQRDKFLSEAVVTGDLEHPNIVPIYDVGTREDGSLFYSMKRVQGTPWMDVIHKKSLHENLEILMKVADAIAFAHDRKVIHRDLKPENVMLGGYGEVLVMDWGLAVPSDGRRIGGIKQSLSMGGTPAYMAPEMAAGPFERIGFCSDIYLLGAILYEIITGKPPHTGEDVMKCLFAAARNKIQPTNKSGELVDIALKAMAHKPEDRYGKVADFQEAIRDYLSHSESVALSTRAAEDLAQAGKSDDYQDYAKALFGYEEAFSLWSGNERAKEGMSETALAYAGAAMRKGDFDLGVSLLQADDPTHGELLVQLKDSIKERDARQRRLKTARRIMIGGAVAIFLIITVASGLIYRQYGIAVAAEKEAVAQKDEADKQRTAAQEAEKDALAQKTEAEKQRTAAEAAEKDALAQKTEAEKQRTAAESAQLVAQQREQEAVKERNEAERQRQLAEYQAYVALIGLAAAKIDENGFDVARQLLESCSDKLRDWEWGRLMHLCEQQSATVAGGTQIETLAVHWDEAANERRIVTGGWNGTAKVWNVPQQLDPNAANNAINEVCTLKNLGGTSFVYSAAFSPDGKVVAVGSNEDDKFVRLFNAETGEQLPTVFSGHTEPVTSVEFSADGKWLLTGGYDNEARLWDAKTGRLLQTYIGHSSWVWDVSFAPPEVDDQGRLLGQQRMVTASQDGTAIVWDLFPEEGADAPNKTPPFRGHLGPIYSAAFSHDGLRVVTGGYDKRVLVWRPDDVKEFEYQKVIEGVAVQPAKFTPFDGHTAAVRSVSFSQDDKLIVSCGHDNTVRIWNVEAGRLHKSIRGHGSWVRACAFTPDSKWVLSGGYDEQIKLWNIEGYNESKVLEGLALKGHTDAILSVEFSEDGKQIVTASRDRSARVWNASSGDAVQDLIEGHAFLATSVAYFPNGIHVATGALDDTVRIWDVTNGTQTRLLDGTGRSAALAISPDGKWILTGSNENTARLWSAEAAISAAMPDAENADDADIKPVFSFEGHGNEVTAVAFTRDSTLAATCDADGLCRVWNVAERKLLHEFDTQTRRIVAAAFSPDGQRLLTASGSTVSQWDLSTGTADPRLALKHTAGIASMALSPDGRVVLTASLDGAVRQWDALRAAVVRTLDHRLIRSGPGVDSETNIVNSVAFSADGRYALTIASQDGTVRMWKWDEGMQTVTEVKSPGAAAPNDPFLDFGALGGVVWSAAFSQEGSQVLTVGGNIARLWEAEPRAIAERSELMTFSPHGVVASASFSQDGTKIVTGSWDNSARIWDAQTGKDVLKLEGEHTRPVNSAVFRPTPPGRPRADQVLTASSDGTAKLWKIDWDKRQAEVILSLDEHTGGLNDAVFSRDGKRILTASTDKSARVWDAETGKLLGVLDDTAAGDGEPAQPRGHRWAVLRAAFSDDGQFVVTGSADDTAKIWYVGGTIARTGREITLDEIDAVLAEEADSAAKEAKLLARMEESPTLPALDDTHTKALTDAGLTRALAVLKRGRAIRLLHTLRGHTASVTSVAFTPGEGTRVLTGSEDYTAKLWDAENGKEILTLKGHDQEVTSVAFSRDGIYALTGSRDGTAIVWLAKSEGWHNKDAGGGEPEIRTAALDAPASAAKMPSLP